MLNQEKSLSILGAFIAVFLLASLTQLGIENYSLNLMLIASMGASTFLIFVTPHSPMAQPWPVIGGHLTSAFIGVACAHWIVSPALAAATAVALSITGMHLLKCLHPPSAATAMIAVLGNTPTHTLNWQFCYEVVMINALIIAVLGILINRYVLRKRYPMLHSHHQHHQEVTKVPTPKFPALTEENFKWAVSQMDGMIDVTEEDLVDLYEFAAEHAQIKKPR